MILAILTSQLNNEAQGYQLATVPTHAGAIAPVTQFVIKILLLKK